jgi:hypothetical protein
LGLPVHRVPRSHSKAAVVCDPRWLLAAAGGDDAAGPEAAASAAAALEAGGGSGGARGGGRGGARGGGRSGGGAAAAAAAEAVPLLLFVDDTLAEHLDEEMRSAPNVVRFLFTRARRTQVADAVPP